MPVRKFTVNEERITQEISTPILLEKYYSLFCMDFISIVVALLSIVVISYLRKYFVSEKQIQEKKSDIAPIVDGKVIKESEASKDSLSCGVDCGCDTGVKPKLKILYGTQTGTSKKYAEKLGKEGKEKKFEVEVHNLSTYNPDEIMEANCYTIFIVSTYTDGTPPESCVNFNAWLEDQYNDFRVSKDHYKNMKYCIFGIGDSIYNKNFNVFAKSMDNMFYTLSATRLLNVFTADNGPGSELSTQYITWSRKLFTKLNTINALNSSSCGPSNSIDANNLNNNNNNNNNDDEEEDIEDKSTSEPLVDMEDLGNHVKKSILKKKRTKVTKTTVAVKTIIKKEKPEATFANSDEEDEDEDVEEEEEEANNNNKEVKEMMTETLREALTKQGYKIIGSHSGVKLCRWTKSQLRGRGGCYKHTFYGIQSYLCMEMTPSLACANKCVFCWRHHKNPVGKEWKWKVDSAEYLVEEGIKQHQSMIKQMKGVPGVVPETFENAFTIRHCALSLVGEPIIYPYINQFVDLLHQRKISSFLVTNAQFPDKIETMSPVTQLYISVDAATKESLKKIDRPLFTDFWERFLACIDALSQKGQRTVFRLTLVKQWNMDEIKNYAELIDRGQPTFVEIKGVTYCGTSNASSLTIKNVPFHEEVVRFSREIINSLPSLKENYDIACEHEHSCCVLIAHKKLKVNDKWHTWIDYDKFHELATSGKPFTAMDYIQETPSWAVAGAPEKGFDPEMVRFKRNKNATQTVLTDDQ